jgi:Transmembrane family 220, helix
MRILKYVFMAIFIAFAIVQYNDPDPYLWIPVYLFPVYLIFKSLSDFQISRSFIYVAIVYIFWSINVFPPEWEGVLLNQGMKTLNIELGRESLGLATVAIILIGLGVSSNKE